MDTMRGDVIGSNEDVVGYEKFNKKKLEKV